MKQIIIDGQTYNLSETGLDIFPNDRIKSGLLYSALDIMNNCLDTIFKIMTGEFPKAFRPKLYVSNSLECNAFAYMGKDIIIHSGLILSAAKLIEQRYSEELLKKHNILNDYSHSKVLSGLRVYLWRYVVLHELYHIWEGHYTWLCLYDTDDSGNIVPRIAGLSDRFFDEAESSLSVSTSLSNLAFQKNMTLQALEFSADSCAVSMLVNLLKYDTDSKGIKDTIQFTKNEIALIIGALATAFCLFDGNAGANFDVLKYNLACTTHPIPSIRLFYAEEIAESMLRHHFAKDEEIETIESEWQKIICDVEPEYKGKIDLGQVFYYTAYTKKAQMHICNVKRRLREIRKTLKPFILANEATELDEEDLEYTPDAEWFTEEGVSLKGWVNPATGKATAIKAPDSKTVIKKYKTGVNDPCPCGSGKKFKKCCRGNGRYDD